jgi:CDP-glucose 4,6-dehydratase
MPVDDLEMNRELSLFRGKRALVVGDTGFKGSWLSFWLHLLVAEVSGFALPPRSREEHFSRLALHKVIRHVDGDIRDLPSLRKAVKRARPHFLFHLAAQSLVRVSYQDPKRTFDTNVGGSVNVLEAVREAPGLRAVIYVTSDKCYRNKEWVWGYRENDELGGGDPYSASKAAAELVFTAYVESYFRKRKELGVASVRAGNVIGGGDWAVDRIVPDCIRALRAGRPIILRHPAATRPWQHVLDPLFGYLVLAARLYQEPEHFRGSWNFGPDGESSRTVRDLADKIAKCWGKGEVRVKAQPRSPHEASWLFLNCDKARKELGWRTRWRFDRAVEETVAWYRRTMQGDDVRAATERQIRAYMESKP